mgnify:CR=1 FL=1
MLKNMSKKAAESDSKAGTQALINELGNKGKTIQYDEEGESSNQEDVEEDFQSNYEEFIKV